MLPEASKFTDPLPLTGTLKLSVPLFPAIWPCELIKRTAVGGAEEPGITVRLRPRDSWLSGFTTTTLYSPGLNRTGTPREVAVERMKLERTTPVNSPMRLWTPS